MSAPAATPRALHPADTAEVQAAVAEHLARGTPLRIAGCGGWLDAGRPVAAGATPLALAGCAGILDYVPGDLTLTARAGTPLAAIAVATRAEGQFLPLAPWGGDHGTLGATIATGTAGPTSAALGLPRDVVLGLEFVDGRGVVVRGGGRVVKNVAGFDLVRLMTGAWGTLGVLTEVTVRLRALPERDETVLLPVPADPARRGALLAALGASTLAPMALELVDATLAARLALGGAACALVRLAGNAEAVGAQRRVLGELADVADAPVGAWDALRVAEPAGALTLRLSALASRLAGTWDAAARLASRIPGTTCHASVARGVVRCLVPRDGAEMLAPALDELAFDGARVHERLPGALWPRLTSPAAGDRLSRGVRDAFDPRRILNPGILGETGERVA